jgi:hypothetical protein
MKAMLLVMVLSLSSITWGASIHYSDDFSSWGWDTPIPEASGVNAASRYWYTEAGNSIFGGVTWYTPINGKYLFVNSVPSFVGNVFKNFRSDGSLASGEYFTDPLISGKMKMESGNDDDSGLYFRIWVLDAAGNGYMGKITRAGGMTLFRVTEGNQTQIATGAGAQGNARTLSLYVRNGVVTLRYYYSPETQYTVSADDATYTNFTSIGFGGAFGYYEHIGIDDVSINAKIIPAADALNYAENFNVWNWDTPIPALSGVNSAAKYWYTEEGNTVLGGNMWGAAMDGKYLYVYNNPGFTGNAYKNFRLDNTLSVTDTFTRPTVSGRFQNDAGGNDAYWLNFRISLLDADGNGYVGGVSRAGGMGLYRRDNGILTLIGTGGGVGGNTRTISLDVNNGLVTLSFYYSFETQYVISIADATYSQFTTIAFGGEYGYFEHMGIDDISLNAVFVEGTPAAAEPTFTPGGPYISGPTKIRIQSETPNAAIYYTIDGTPPTVESNLYSGPVIANDGVQLQAVAIAEGYAVSKVSSLTFDVPDVYNGPAVIPAGAVNVDGDLSDWTGASWTAINQVYEGNPSDILSASYAARWQAGKIYLAVKVQDNAHHFTDGYGESYDIHDGIEIYLHTDNNAALDYPNCAAAQEYILGIKSTNQTQLWSALGNGSMYPTNMLKWSDGLLGGLGVAAGSVDGEWIYYEVQLTPFTYLGIVGGTSNLVTTLDGGEVIGLDVNVVGHNGSAFTGVKSENPTPQKFGNWKAFGLHKLFINSGDANYDGAVDVGDLGILAANYGTTSGSVWAKGDFNGDGAVDVGDLGILAANYGTGSNSSMSWDAAYTQAFGTTVEDNADETAGSSICSSLGLPLIGGLMLMGLMLVKLEE